MLFTALQQHALLDALRDPAFVDIVRRLTPVGLRVAIYGDLGPIFVHLGTIDPAKVANDNGTDSQQDAQIHPLTAADKIFSNSAADAKPPEAASIIEGRPGFNCFPDQGAKLNYLLRIRGDQRERSRGNPSLARDADDGGDKRDHRSPVVFSQSDLAEFLNVSPAEVCRWFNNRKRIPDRLLPELCRLYAISEDMFRAASKAIFLRTYSPMHPLDK